MSQDPLKNGSYGTVAAGGAPSPATTGTTLTLSTGDGARFPQPSTDGPFNVTAWPSGAQPIFVTGSTSANAEIARCTARAGDVLTITRAQEGTSAQSIAAGWQVAATVTAKTLTDAQAVGISGYCGNGSDGNVTITGGTTTLTRDMFYDTLTVTGTGVLKPDGFRIFCKTACIVNTGGVIQRDGTASGGGSGGNGGTNRALAKGGDGGGGSTTNGSSGGGTTEGSGYGGAGGAGGNGGTGTGGGGGTAGSRNATKGGSFALPWLAMGMEFGLGGTNWIPGGAGGGGGGGDGTNDGGGGGGGGSPIIINARSVVNNGTISSNGGNGFTRTAHGNSGGGGGGGGGVVIINCASFTGNTPTATGGTGGGASGTGVTGSNGSSGAVLVNAWT